MSDASAKWGDLAPRLFSAIGMLVIGIVAVWAGGVWIHGLVSLSCGLMVWELVRMLHGAGSQRAIWLAFISGFALFAASYAPYATLLLPLLLAPSFVGFSLLSAGPRPFTGRRIFMSYTAMILIAGFSLIALRDDFGIVWMAWFLIVVIVSDVAGYFAGRIFGGPKFWPAVSPKKTWSGTIAGWIGAAIVGSIFAALYGGGFTVIVVSVAAALAAQLGDIAESAIKRHVGVKDSSNLIPGHGGLLDRFDGMLGAALLLIIVELFLDFPPSVAG
ncbi:phosphatidate cytidylyltransferase [Planktotalea sp.]|uniref:phosphatidate cytidylyltransferase n=1 Tax=Planktotalea sp. TaxID=2029877 RepID=UPI0035C86818